MLAFSDAIGYKKTSARRVRLLADETAFGGRNTETGCAARHIIPHLDAPHQISGWSPGRAETWTRGLDPKTYGEVRSYRTSSRPVPRPVVQGTEVAFLSTPKG